jgi:hypothetical protein
LTVNKYHSATVRKEVHQKGAEEQNEWSLLLGWKKPDGVRTQISDWERPKKEDISGLSFQWSRKDSNVPSSVPAVLIPYRLGIAQPGK